MAAAPVQVVDPKAAKAGDTTFEKYEASQGFPQNNPAGTQGTGTNGTGQSFNDANAPGKTYSAPAAPTVGTLYGSGPLDDAAAAADAAKTAAYDPETIKNNEANTRADVLGSYKTQLDGLDSAAAAARARITTTFAPTAAARVGESTAIQARRGLLGSDFGAAQSDTVNKANADELAGKIGDSDANYTTQKNSLMQFITGEADKEIALRQDATQKGADAKISEIQNRTARAQTSATASVKAMIAAGITDSTNPNYKDTIANIASSTGLSPDQVTSLFTDTKKAADAAAVEQQKAEADAAKAKVDAATAGQTTLSPGQVLVGPDGKIIQKIDPTSKYDAVSGTLTDEYGNQTAYVRIYDTTTGRFVGGGGAGVGGGTSGGGGGTPGVTLPTAPTTPTPTPTPTTTDTLFGANSQYAGSTVEDALSKLGVDGSAATTANVDPKAKISDLPPDQQKALSSAIDAAGGTQQDNPNVPFAQYGLLSKTDYNPKDQTDQLANLYLDKYIKSGSVPTASTLGRNIKSGLMAKIASRAQDLYFKATGNPLPNPNIIKAQQDIIVNNYKLGNNLKIQEQTVKNNVDLSLENMTKNKINSSGFAPLDALIKNFDTTFQDPNVAQFVAQNSTIQNEIGSLLAVKNAGGTTVYDKISGSGLLPKDASPADIKRVIETIIKEAGNFSDALSNANGTAYGFTDPLLQDANNPARATYQNKGKVSTQDNSGTDNSGGSTAPITAPDGQQIIITD